MKKFILFYSSLLTASIFSQDQIQFDIFNASIENSFLTVSNIAGNKVYSKLFINPVAINYDLDEDGVNELLVQDSFELNGKPFYKLFIYNTIDSFYLVDSIISGSYEPYQALSGETGGTILVSGDYRFDFLNGGAFSFLPINCWKFEGGELFLVNDEVYENYLTENESIIKFLDNHYSANVINCSSIESIKSAIAAAFINYQNAGEKSVASQFIKKYYLCDDIEGFVTKLNNLIQ